MDPENIPEFLRASFDRGYEASIADVAGLFQIPLTEHPFELCIAVEAEVKKYGIQMVPALPKGSDQSRRLFCSPRPGLSLEELKARIAMGEGATAEFKSTMICCMKTYLANNNASKAELKSDAVFHGVMKTIAAFLNTSGGSLYVGIDDSGGTVGLERDFAVMDDGADVDKWELRLRSGIEGLFIDGKLINNLIQICFTVVDGLTAAHVSVARRQKVSYLKSQKAAGHDVFVRQGNRTVSLNFPEFEQFLLAR